VRIVDAAIARAGRRSAMPRRNQPPRRQPNAATGDRHLVALMNEAPKLSEHELARRQAIMDAQWELTLIEKEHRREEAERRSFHKASGDPDWVN